MIAMRPLLDGLPGTPAADATGVVQQIDPVALVNELVDAALDEHRHIEAIDTYGTRKKGRRYLTDPQAPVYRKMHEDWLADAEVLLSRVRVLQNMGHLVPREQDLQIAVMTTRGLLTFTLEKIMEGVEKMRQGDFVTLEEVRRGVRTDAKK
jgi:hypothetical protein